MDEILLAHRPNANKKYYVFVHSWITRLMEEPGVVLSSSVKELLEGSPITRPTFYSYFSSAEAFYEELMEITAKWLPLFMAKKSQELQTGDFLEIAFSMKIGILINNIKKASDQFPALRPLWDSYYNNANKQIGVWYKNSQDMDDVASRHAARFVVNELVLNCDKYYTNFESYQSLMLDQQVVSY